MSFLLRRIRVDDIFDDETLQFILQKHVTRNHVILVSGTSEYPWDCKEVVYVPWLIYPDLFISAFPWQNRKVTGWWCVELLARWPPAHFEGAAAQLLTCFSSRRAATFSLFSSAFQYLGNNTFKHKNLIKAALRSCSFYSETCHMPGSQSSRLSCSRRGAFRSDVATWRHAPRYIQIYPNIIKYQIFPAFFRTCLGVYTLQGECVFCYLFWWKIPWNPWVAMIWSCHQIDLGTTSSAPRATKTSRHEWGESFRTAMCCLDSKFQPATIPDEKAYPDQNDIERSVHPLFCRRLV